MNIVINAVLGYEKPRGVGRYLNDLLPALAEEDNDNNYFIYYGKWMKDYSFIKIKKSNFHFIELDIRNNQISRNLYLSIVLPLVCKKHKPDVFFLVDTQAIFIKTCKIVSTIHDIAEYQFEEKYSKKQRIIRKMIVWLQARISDVIITDSNYSKSGICRILRINENKVHVIYLATNMPIMQDIQTPDNYFLFVSETERAKNLMGFIDSYDMLPENYKEKYKIKVVGKKGNDYENIIEKIKQKDLEKNFEFYGYVSDEELNNLYKKAYAFVFPSFFEGFGLPVLEAMAKGTPVLCSDSSSISEVGGDAVLKFNPYNPDELKEQLLNVINNTNLRQEMIGKGFKRVKQFTYNKTARETLAVFNEMKINEYKN